jgi:NAD(P)H-quinone oxidoreductase subunit 5
MNKVRILLASLEYLEPLRITLLLAVPLLYVLASCLANWRVARACTALAVGVSAASLALLAGGGALIGYSLRADALGCIVLLLVTFIGWVIARYSQTYMGGDASQARYVRWLMATLAAVSGVVVTNNLAVLALSWLATSLCLHQLLMFFSHRPAAVIAAHKKFLASRLGDLCLFAGAALIATSLGSLEIDQVIQKAQTLSVYPIALKAAVFLIVISALLKCAQLPVHGWLIQVMEAPTPVSALLHAGIVNLGGFLLIRLSPLVSEVGGAQTLLVVVGSLTAALAALVMMTRISVKVMLAWSTCAQMGFMLMQCGLGAYDLALLHLVAHSLYKAHAFLAAGGAVEQARLKAMTVLQPDPSLSMLAVGAVSGLVMVAASGMVWGMALEPLTAMWVLAAIVSLAIAPLLTAQALKLGGLWPLGMMLGAFGVAFAYFGLHHVFGWFVDVPKSIHANMFDLLWVMVCFTLLFVMQCLIRARPHGAVASRFYPWFYAGLYLDEWFTRTTFRVWPVKLSIARPIARTGVSK